MVNNRNTSNNRLYINPKVRAELLPLAFSSHKVNIHPKVLLVRDISKNKVNIGPKTKADLLVQDISNRKVNISPKIKADLLVLAIGNSKVNISSKTKVDLLGLNISKIKVNISPKTKVDLLDLNISNSTENIHLMIKTDTATQDTLWVKQMSPGCGMMTIDSTAVSATCEGWMRTGEEEAGIRTGRSARRPSVRRTMAGCGLG